MNNIHFIDESHIFLFLVQFFILLGSAKLLGLLFTKIKQPTITADILVGIILGPSVLGRFLPEVYLSIFPNDYLQKNMLETLSWIGILLLLLVTGLEVNFSSVWKQKNQSIKISIADIIIPILITFLPVYFLPDRFLVRPDDRILFSVFISVIMTISAMPVAIRGMRDLRILQTDMGFLVISALAINDVIGWMIFTIVLGLFSNLTLELSYIFRIISLTLGFAGFALTLGKKIVSKSISYIKNKTYDDTGNSLTFVVLLGLFFGAITHKIGIHALFGFFIAGLIAGEAKDLSENTRNIIIRIVYSVFVPLFFVNIGLKFDLIESLDFFLVLFITLVGIIARLIGAYVGSILAKTPKANRWPIAILHTPGGEMHIVISTLAIELGLISRPVYVAIIFGAVISSMIMGPWLSYVIRKRNIESEKMKSMISLIIPEFEAKNKMDAISKLCKAASHISGVDYNKILNGVLIREEQFSTAIENGIAIPHAKLVELNEPIVIFARSKLGIEWNSMDNKLTNLIFLVLTPVSDKDIQIEIYSKIASSVSKEIIREDLLKAPDEESINKIFEISFGK